MFEWYLIIKKPYRAGRSVIKGAAKDVQLVCKIGKGALLKLLHRSDYKRWTDAHNLEPWWDTRTEKIAQLIPEGSRVIEFGAGRRQLEKLLNPIDSYIPSDLTSRGPGTVICDLNQRPLPDLRYLGATMAVFGGVLEYILNLESLVQWLSDQFSFCVASYTCLVPALSDAERVRERLARLRFGYMNSYTEAEFVHLFARYGFTCVKRNTWTNQTLFLFTIERSAVPAPQSSNSNSN